MPVVNPCISFWLGVAVTILVGIGGGSVSLTNVVPEAWVPTVHAVSNLLGFIGTAILTALHGISSGQKGPLVK